MTQTIVVLWYFTATRYATRTRTRVHARAYTCRNILTASYDLNLSRRARSQKEAMEKISFSFRDVHVLEEAALFFFLFINSFFSLYVSGKPSSCDLWDLCFNLCDFRFLHINAIEAIVSKASYIASIVLVLAWHFS